MAVSQVSDKFYCTVAQRATLLQAVQLVTRQRRDTSQLTGEYLRCLTVCLLIYNVVYCRSPPPSPPIALPLSPPAGYPGPSMMPTAPQHAAIYYELPYGPNASLYPATFYPFNPQLYGSQYGYIPPHFLPPSPQMVQYS